MLLILLYKVVHLVQFMRRAQVAVGASLVRQRNNPKGPDEPGGRSPAVKNSSSSSSLITPSSVVLLCFINTDAVGINRVPRVSPGVTDPTSESTFTSVATPVPPSS
jgi:hypothetical protein